VVAELTGVDEFWPDEPVLLLVQLAVLPPLLA
jgi:hypothetical protein